MSAIRVRRLYADYEKLQKYVRHHPRLRLVRADGDPPESYQLEYGVRSLRQVDDDLQVVDSHLVEIVLPGSYPRLPPQCRMLTPIFHPNIAPHAICIGDHWSAGEPLWRIVARIGEMLAYQSYNIKSPLNGEAARWVSGHMEELPLDPVSMLVEEEAGTPVAPPAPAPVLPAPPPAAAALAFAEGKLACPQCGTMLRVPAGLAGKRVRCPRCLTIVTVPAEF